MDLNTIEHVVRPGAREALPAHAPGDAFLAGGTSLFSEPQPHLRRLIDLASLGWTPVETSEQGLRIAATCTLEQLAAVELLQAWPALALFAPTAEALWGSFKIHKAATVGGNLCLALPAAPVAALAASLEAVCEIWRPDGSAREIAALDFIVDDNRNVLEPGELLRAIRLPARALQRRAVFRQASLTVFGRSGALVIAARDVSMWTVTITAAVRRPVQVVFAARPRREALSVAIDAAVPASLLHDDVHGSPAWRRHMMHRLAREAIDAL